MFSLTLDGDLLICTLAVHWGPCDIVSDSEKLPRMRTRNQEVLRPEMGRLYRGLVMDIDHRNAII